MLAELTGNRAVDQGTPDHLPDAFAVLLVRLVDQRQQVDRNIFGLRDSRPPGVFRAVTHTATFVVELPRRDFPPLARFTDDGVIPHVDVVEELFAEFDGTVDLLDAVDRYCGMRQR